MDDLQNSDFTEVDDDISDVSWFDIPVIVIFLILIALVAAQFLTRYVLNDSLGWTEEIARYFLILLGFVGGISCIRKGSHISLEFIYRFVPTSAVKSLAVVSEMLTSGFFLYMGILAWQLAVKTSGRSMTSVQFPKSSIYYCVSVACVGMAVFSAIHLFQATRMSADRLRENRLGNLG